MRVPAEEAAWFKFPASLKESEQVVVPATVAAAIQLAMEDFRPRGTKPHRGSDPVEACLYQRPSFDVEAAPWTEDLVLVRFSLSHGACIEEGPVLDMGSTHAVDPRRSRIVAVHPGTPPAEAANFTFPVELPLQGLIRIDGNTAAAIQLAMDHFRPWEAPPSRQPACLDRRDSYDVTAAPGPEGVVLVQLTLDDQRCPPDPSESVEATSGKPLQEIVLYAVDIRTQRLLSIGRRFQRHP
ncbi:MULTISPECIES: hypothetical protein [Corallococcus]|uniref:hypothetical protein n=1 Tax=Corallococcus TaxID=83461 RepID=UPI001F2A79F2|nr:MULTISPECIES: hypothetical protein [Corallococcus]